MSWLLLPMGWSGWVVKYCWMYWYNACYAVFYLRYRHDDSLTGKCLSGDENVNIDAWLTVRCFLGFGATHLKELTLRKFITQSIPLLLTNPFSSCIVGHGWNRPWIEVAWQSLPLDTWYWVTAVYLTINLLLPTSLGFSWVYCGHLDLGPRPLQYGVLDDV